MPREDWDTYWAWLVADGDELIGAWTLGGPRLVLVAGVLKMQ